MGKEFIHRDITAVMLEMYQYFPDPQDMLIIRLKVPACHWFRRHSEPVLVFFGFIIQQHIRL